MTSRRLDNGKALDELMNDHCRKGDHKKSFHSGLHFWSMATGKMLIKVTREMYCTVFELVGVVQFALGMLGVMIQA